MNRVTVAGVILLLLAGGPASAATIHAGNHVLFENMADQTIEIWVTGGDPVEQTAGTNLRVQIGDGGPELGGSIDGPEFIPDTVSGPPFGSGADLRTGAIFTGDPGAGGGAVYVDLDEWLPPPDTPPGWRRWDPGELLYPQFLLGTAALPDSIGTVAADGLLATLTVSTEGFFASDNNNPWELKVTSLVAGAGQTELLDNSPTPQPLDVSLVNGTITLAVPEPATIVMLLGVLAVVPFVFLRGKRKNRAK